MPKNERLRIRLIGGLITHLVTWSNVIGGFTHCGINFSWLIIDADKNNGWIVAGTVKDNCDCMACLVKAA